MVRRLHKCPVCGQEVKRMTPHIKVMHMAELENSYKCRLWANYAVLDGVTQYRGLDYRVCPVEDCPSFIAAVTVHLRNCHRYSADQARKAAKESVKVKYIIWSVPTGTDTPRIPVRDTLESPPTQSTSTSSLPISRPSSKHTSVPPPPLLTRPIHNDTCVSPAPSRARDLDTSIPATVSTSQSSETETLPPVKRSRPSGLSTITGKWYDYLVSDIGGKVAARHAIQYARRVEAFLSFSNGHACPQKALQLKTMQRFNAQSGKGDSWRKNTYHFLIKFAVYLQFRAKVTEGFVSSLRDSTRGVRKVLGREIKKTALRKQNTKRPLLLKFDPNEFIKNPVMVKAIKGMAVGVSGANVEDRSFLISRMIINSGVRAGAVAGATIAEIEGAEQIHVGGRSSFVVSVSDHKTSLAGAHQIPLTHREHRALLNLIAYVKTRHPDAQYTFLTAEGVPFNTSRICYEHNKTWKRTGVLTKYGKFSSTDNRKRIATVMGSRFPELREKTAKQLKHSVAVEKAIYDHTTGARFAVEIVSLLARDFARSSSSSSTKDANRNPTLALSCRTETAPNPNPSPVPSSNASVAPPEPFEYASTVYEVTIYSDPAPCPEPLESGEGVPTPVPSSQNPSVVHSVLTGEPGSFSHDSSFKPAPGSISGVEVSNISPSKSSLGSRNSPQKSRVGEWLSGLPGDFDAIEEESAVMVANDSTVYESATAVLFQSGKTGVRRVWSVAAVKNFQLDWKFEIELSSVMMKKPTLKAIRQKLAADIRLRVRWAEMSEANIKDKIWVEAKKLKTIKPKTAQQEN